MDQVKIGKFIAEMRKTKGLTQKELAEKLGLSDKAVSKWECGNGLPDNSVMLMLCELLDISVNELLSGERLSSSDYNKKAEENMMSLIRETKVNNNSHKRNTIATLASEILLGLLIAYAIITSGGISSFNNFFFDAPTLFIVLGIILLMLFSTKMAGAFFHAFTIFLNIKEPASAREIEKSLEAIRLAVTSSFLGGALVLVISVISFLHNMSEPSTFGPCVAVACLSIFYSVVIVLFLTPIVMKLKLLLQELKNMDTM